MTEGEGCKLEIFKGGRGECLWRVGLVVFIFFWGNCDLHRNYAWILAKWSNNFKWSNNSKYGAPGPFRPAESENIYFTWYFTEHFCWAQRSMKNTSKVWLLRRALSRKCQMTSILPLIYIISLCENYIFSCFWPFISLEM